MNNDIQKVVDWLGPHPIDRRRLNAKGPLMMDTMVYRAAVMGENSDLLSILLRLGADVDPVDAHGLTPLSMCYKPDKIAQARLLLEWGAEISNIAAFSKRTIHRDCG